MDLSIITVTYNSQDHITGLLDSIQKSPDDLKKEVIVVDNNSQDKSAELAGQHSSQPTVIRAYNNQGFSKGVNQGIKEAKGDYILLINPDTRLVGNCLQYLYDFAQSKKTLGAVAPRLLDMDGKPQPSVSRFPTILNALRHYFLGCQNCFGKYLPTQITTQVPLAVMAAFLIPTSTIKKIGLLNEKFFLYYEDIEYAKRLKKANLPIYYHSKAKVRHAHGASGNFTDHLNSPLLKSARQYHGQVGSRVLNFVLRVGQKYQKLLRRFSS